LVQPEGLNASIQRERDKPPSTLRQKLRIAEKLTTKCWVGFIDWLDGLIDMQAHVLNAFATAASNDNIR